MTTNNEYSDRIKAEFEDILFEKKAVVEKEIREVRRKMKHCENTATHNYITDCKFEISRLEDILLTINEWLDKINK